MDRKTALALGEIKYFTGAPCRNGHIAPRYTQSGTCAECIRPSKKPHHITEDMNAEKVERRRRYEQRHAALLHFVEVKIRAFPQDWPLIFDTAAALAMQRSPALIAEDLRISGKYMSAPAAGTHLYHLRMHPDDIETVRAVANICLNQRSARGAEVREAVLARVLDDVKKAAQELPWRP